MGYNFELAIQFIMYSKHMEDKFVVTPKEDKTVTMTIRIDRSLQEEYNELSEKTNRSRNELISMALRYALDNMVIKEKDS